LEASKASLLRGVPAPGASAAGDSCFTLNFKERDRLASGSQG